MWKEPHLCYGLGQTPEELQIGPKGVRAVDSGRSLVALDLWERREERPSLPMFCHLNVWIL